MDSGFEAQGVKSKGRIIATVFRISPRARKLPKGFAHRRNSPGEEFGSFGSRTMGCNRGSRKDSEIEAAK